VCSEAIRGDHFLTLLELKRELPPSRHGSGVDEFRRVFSILRTRDQCPELASQTKLLLREPVKLWSLSPSSEESLRFRESILLLAGENAMRQRVCGPAEDHGSVVLWVDAEPWHLLLGGDLECGTEPHTGWQCILSSSTRPLAKAHAFKVPHHGAGSAYHPDVWGNMLAAEPVAILTPWQLAGQGAAHPYRHRPHHGAYRGSVHNSTPPPQEEDREAYAGR